MSTNLYDLTLERDRVEFSLGDTLDVKADIIIAIITILGTLAGTLLSAADIPKWEQIAQLVSIGFLAVSCFCAVLAVIPRQYLMAATPQDLQSWQTSLRKYYAENPDLSAQIDSVVDENMITLAAARIETNHAINSGKSRWLEISIWPLLAALVIDIGTRSRRSGCLKPFLEGDVWWRWWRWWARRITPDRGRLLWKRCWARWFWHVYSFP